MSCGAGEVRGEYMGLEEVRTASGTSSTTTRFSAASANAPSPGPLPSRKVSTRSPDILSAMFPVAQRPHSRDPLRAVHHEAPTAAGSIARNYPFADYRVVTHHALKAVTAVVPSGSDHKSLGTDLGTAHLLRSTPGLYIAAGRDPPLAVDRRAPLAQALEDPSAAPSPPRSRARAVRSDPFLDGSLSNARTPQGSGTAIASRHFSPYGRGRLTDCASAAATCSLELRRRQLDALVRRCGGVKSASAFPARHRVAYAKRD
jgi:hypothetical protein